MTKPQPLNMKNSKTGNIFEQQTTKKCTENKRSQSKSPAKSRISADMRTTRSQIKGK